MVNNQLRSINFSSGIFSSPLNYNYNLIHDWLKRERLRLGGYGIANGFEMSYDNNYGINISAGVLIDRYGEEIITEDTTIYCGKPAAEKKEEELLVGENGRVELKFHPYSPTYQGWITYNPPVVSTLPNATEFYITTADETRAITPLAIVGKTVGVSERFANQKIKITYYASNDKIDAFLLKSDGTIIRQTGIESESPSSADIEEQLKQYFLIGFAHWIIKDTVSVEFIIDDRTYRKVYVDDKNRLWLNGKLYIDASLINYSKPSLLKDGEFWYDKENNILYAWSEKLQEWQIVNDFSTTLFREVAFWTPEENPEDLQTFLFDEQALNLRFIPGQNSLEIIIDHIPVMQDQFEEIVLNNGEEPIGYGAGFKLSYPLDKKSYVQCIVHQQGSNETLKNTFQKAAIFIDENSISYSASNINQIFVTELPYIAGENQLEIYVDGAKLPRYKFNEMLNIDTIAKAEHAGTKISMFNVLQPLIPGQIVTYKISRYVWSYSQLNEFVETIRTNANKALEKADKLEQEIQTLSENFEEKINAIKKDIDNQSKEIAQMNLYRKKTDSIKLSDLSDEIKQKLYNSSVTLILNATSIQNETFSNCHQGDIFLLSYTNSNGGRQLINGTEYTITFNEKAETATINLSSIFISSENTIYATIIRFGGN